MLPKKQRQSEINTARIQAVIQNHLLQSKEALFLNHRQQGLLSETLTLVENHIHPKRNPKKTALSTIKLGSSSILLTK
jgi:hypothetical protein